MVNKDEMTAMVDAVGTRKRDEEEDVQALAARLDGLLSGEVNIACTLGAEGVFLSYRVGRINNHSSMSTTTFTMADLERRTLSVPSGKLLSRVVDTTGAGDCFSGTFAAGLMRIKQGGGSHQEDMDLETALRDVVEECMAVSSSRRIPSFPISTLSVLLVVAPRHTLSIVFLTAYQARLARES